MQIAHIARAILSVDPHRAPEGAGKETPKNEMVSCLQCARAYRATNTIFLDDRLPQQDVAGVDLPLDKEPTEELHRERRARAPKEISVRRAHPPSRDKA